MMVGRTNNTDDIKDAGSPSRTRSLSPRALLHPTQYQANSMEAVDASTIARASSCSGRAQRTVEGPPPADAKQSVKEVMTKQPKTVMNKKKPANKRKRSKTGQQEQDKSGKKRRTESLIKKRQERWDKMFGKLKSYKDTHGDCLVPQQSTSKHGDCLVPVKDKNNPHLGTWVRSQRSAFKANKMSIERKTKLDSIGFVWVQKSRWDDMFEKLKSYKDSHGDCLVTRDYKNDPQLGNWVHQQRQVAKDNKMLADRKAKLDSIGFVWVAGKLTTGRRLRWNEMFDKLKSYKETHGDCLVPQKYTGNDGQLAGWVKMQRAAAKANTILDDRKAKLDSIGFVWSVHAGYNLWNQLSWDEMFEKLEAYKSAHGDCLVPRVYKNDPQLGSWVHTQRSAYKANEMPTERKTKLDSIGFVWSVGAGYNLWNRLSWDEMFEKLEAYKSAHGDCLVPRFYKNDPQLGSWVHTQRSVFKANKMPTERKTKLDSIGFVWSAYKDRTPWNEMFERLKANKSVHGDCLVPQCYQNDPQLRGWVTTQRRAFKFNKMLAERKAKLDSIGFVFYPRHQQWNDLFEQQK